eukprot:scaffold1302_cov64-Phaeocystis_antarctica.AAC.4
MMHGKHSAAVEPLLAQWPCSLVVAMLEHGRCARTCSLVEAVAVEETRLVERGHRQRLRRPLRLADQLVERDLLPHLRPARVIGEHGPPEPPRRLDRPRYEEAGVVVLVPGKALPGAAPRACPAAPVERHPLRAAGPRHPTIAAGVDIVRHEGEVNAQRQERRPRVAEQRHITVHEPQQRRGLH